jgi:putative membrane-bound dehydrogenase-like protein
MMKSEIRIMKECRMTNVEKRIVAFVAILLPSLALAQSQGPGGTVVPVAEAVTRIKAPEGFKVSVFAAEPDIVQPIASCIDDRGRLWVGQCTSYPTWAEKGNDKIIIFEDTDGDGKFDKRTVFADNLNYLTGLQVAGDGVYVASAPNLLYFEDKNHDDKPDGPPKVLLDGWTAKGVHNVICTLTWGPEGWLYGGHGITAASSVGKPGTPEDARTPVGPGLWRYHPKEDIFEYYCEGTCNPWGVDYNAQGHIFFSSSVVPHMYHAIQGAHYQRMFGHDFNAYVYGQLKSITDHLHWAGGDWTSWTSSRGGQGANGTAGGGHSHCGLMIYQGEGFPQEYRGTPFLANIHGNRINNDSLARSGSGYVCSHRPDFLFMNDRMSMGTSLQYGPDGGVYYTDWYDGDECHTHKPDRTTGRVYKITYQTSQPIARDLRELDDAKLVELQTSNNEFYVRHARRILQERGSKRGVHEALMKMLKDDADPVHRLRALWTLHATEGLNEETLMQQLGSEDENMRGWAIQLLCEMKKPSESARSKFAQMAVEDNSPLVRLYLAMALQRMPLEQRWPIISKLVGHGEDAKDQNLPLMYWYAIEPLVPADNKRAVALMGQSKVPIVREYITRRLTSSPTTKPAGKIEDR